ncbi:glycosyl transferase family 1, partial [Escherichia coli]|nr:glycosyl transferase family 1 [Escherichia coli]
FPRKALKRFEHIKDDYDARHAHFRLPFMDMLLLSARPRARILVTYLSYLVKQNRLRRLYRPLQERFLSGVD